jgi:hypothetical protein
MTKFWDKRCKTCQALRSKRYSKEQLKKNPFKYICGKKKSQAKYHGINFDISPEYLEKMWNKQNGLCFALAVPLDLYSPEPHDYKASLDRIVPEMGYIEGNVTWLSSLANRVKTNCTDPEVFLKVADYVRKTNQQEQPEFDFSFPN